MLYDNLTKLIRTYFYITSYDRFKSETSGLYLERFTCKHPLLKPKLIVQNNQPFGFKAVPKQMLGLEKYPYFCEIQYSTLENQPKYVEACEICSEVSFSELDHQQYSSLLELIDIYEHSVQIEEIRSLSETDSLVLSITSKIQDTLSELADTELDMDEEISEAEIKNLLDPYFFNFNKFIKNLDNVVFKRKPIPELDRLIPLLT